MKTIGLIGGMSWQSSIEYYRIINEAVDKRLGHPHSAVSLMYSVDFAEIESLQHAGRWDEATAVMLDAARRLAAGGADFVVICTNTMHKMADAVQASIQIPILHIADATAVAIKLLGLKKVALLGTRFTMQEDFYKGRLIQKHGLDVLVPDADEQEIIHRVIYDELIVGRILPESRAAYRSIMQHLVERGAQGIILGCTEIGLLVDASDSTVPLFDTTRLHAEAAVDEALKG
ncbi:MAG: aspartate/glutamate racemase family protein [Anaerolineae bacterium]|nr:aspartate/glutamate racemase family protein [Anaerolineae bacterium]